MAWKVDQTGGWQRIRINSALNAHPLKNQNPKRVASKFVLLPYASTTRRSGHRPMYWQLAIDMPVDMRILAYKEMANHEEPEDPRHRRKKKVRNCENVKAHTQRAE
jgi:hypothetical protein